jgi:hypothetical protein
MARSSTTSATPSTEHPTEFVADLQPPKFLVTRTGGRWRHTHVMTTTQNDTEENGPLYGIHAHELIRFTDLPGFAGVVDSQSFATIA